MKNLSMKKISMLIFSLLVVVCCGGLFLLQSNVIKAAGIHRAPADIRKDIAEKQEENGKIMKELDALVKETNTKTEQLAANIEQKKTKLNEAITKKENAKKERTTINNNLELKNKLKKEVISFLKEKENLDATNTIKINLDNDIKALEDRLEKEASENEKATIKNDLELKKKEREEKETLIASINNNIAALKHAENINTENLDSEIQELQNKLQVKDAEIDNLMAEVTTLSTEINNITAEIEKKFKDTENYITQKTNSIEKKINTLDKELVAAERIEIGKNDKNNKKADNITGEIIDKENPEKAKTKDKKQKDKEKLPQTGGFKYLLGGIVLLGLGASLETFRKFKKNSI